MSTAAPLPSPACPRPASSARAQLPHRVAKCTRLWRLALPTPCLCQTFLVLATDSNWCCGQVEPSFHGWVVDVLLNRTGGGLHCTTSSMKRSDLT